MISGGVILDALFEDNLTTAEMEAALHVSVTRERGQYSQFLYTDDTENLVRFSDLIGIDVKQKVTLSQYRAIETIVENSWAAASTSMFGS